MQIPRLRAPRFARNDILLQIPRLRTSRFARNDTVGTLRFARNDTLLRTLSRIHFPKQRSRPVLTSLLSTPFTAVAAISVTPVSVYPLGFFPLLM